MMELISTKDKEIEELRHRLRKKTEQYREKDEKIMNAYEEMWHKDQVIAEKEARAPQDFGDEATVERKHKIEQLKQELHQATYKGGQKDPQARRDNCSIC